MGGYTVGAVASVDTNRETTSPTFYTTGVVAGATTGAGPFNFCVSGIIGNVGGGAANIGFQFGRKVNENLELGVGFGAGATGKIWLDPIDFKGQKVHDYKLEYSGHAGVYAAVPYNNTIFHADAGVRVGQQNIGNTYSLKNKLPNDPETNTYYYRNFCEPSVSIGATFKIKGSNRSYYDHNLDVSLDVAWGSNGKQTEVMPSGITRAKDWSIDKNPTIGLTFSYTPQRK